MLLCISVVTEGELTHGALRLGKAKRDKLLREIAALLYRVASVVPVTRDVAQTWARMKRDAELRARPLSQNDLWIAATSVAHDMILVAHDRDFEAIPDLKLEDWVA